jgi:hypothetical protein
MRLDRAKGRQNLSKWRQKQIFSAALRGLLAYDQPCFLRIMGCVHDFVFWCWSALQFFHQDMMQNG